MTRNQRKKKVQQRKQQQKQSTKNSSDEKTFLHNEIKVENSNLLKNGLSEAILGYEPGGFGTQLSQVDTMFVSNRWYLVSNMRQLLSQIYVEHGLVQTVIDVPVNDALRGGVEIKSKELDDDNIALLQNKMEREGDLETVAQAQKWNRLFGGAGIIIITNQEYDKPIELDKIAQGDPVDFRAVDMWELFWSKQNTDDYSVAINQEEVTNVEFYDYYGKQLHNSRVLQLIGLKAPSFVRPRLRGWGFSVMESIVRSINQYLKATDLAFEVLDEFKIDVYKIKGLAQTLLTPNGEQVVQKRVEIANQQKNYQSAITMDGEDDYMQKQISFAGISEAMDGIRKQLASDLRMPLTKLFGVSSAGFNSGEDDIENYNAMVESSIRSKTKFEIVKLIEIRCQQLFGFMPKDLEIDFKPLRVLSSEQEEGVKSQRFSRLLQARQAGEISSKEFKEACNTADLLPIKVEANDTLYPTPAGGKEGGGEAPKAPASTTTAPAARNSYVRSTGNEPYHVACAAVVSDGYVLTGQRHDSGLWTFPGGHMERMESPREAAARETSEEAGIFNLFESLKEKKVEVVKGREGADVMVHPFIAELDSRVPPRKELDPDCEVKQWKWVKIDKDTLELKPENRHHVNDVLLKHILTKGEK